MQILKSIENLFLYFDEYLTKIHSKYMYVKIFQLLISKFNQILFRVRISCCLDICKLPSEYLNLNQNYF